MNILLRDIHKNDLPILFEEQKDPEANYMAAFTSKEPDDWDAFLNHWNKIMPNRSIITKTILLDNIVVGQVLSFLLLENREVSYWIGKEYWGRGIATKALIDFLKILDIRPLYARTAYDNIGSIRVLEKCGFNKIEKAQYFANARKKEIEEYIFELIEKSVSVT